eukprot:Gb_18703 [translate_table: standard]
MKIILNKHPKIFQDLPRGIPPNRGMEHRIDIELGKGPTVVKPYQYSFKKKSKLEKIIEELLEMGVIEESSSPYSTPIVLAQKKDGSFRMCIDYRALNNITIKNKFPMPRINDLIDELQGAMYFSKIDLKSGHYQIPIEDQEKTTFSTHHGHYEFKVMPFGLCNAPATFQGLMNKVFIKCLRKFLVIFFDDILVYNKTWDEHLQHVDKVLSILEGQQLYAKQSKCTFGWQSLEYLGHIITREGVKVDPAKVEAIPPLIDLTKKDSFKWNDAAEVAFKRLKEALTMTPVLANPNFDKPFVLECDASGTGIGAMLMKDGRQISFESCKLNEREKRMLTYNKEMLAIMHALQKWRQYLLGSKFEVKTDHSSLKHLLHQETPTDEQGKWVDKIQAFNFNITYKRGKDNIVADALSRKYEDEVNAMVVVEPKWVQDLEA